MPFFILDISRYQGSINLKAVKDAGITGVICKATNGTAGQTPTSTKPYFYDYARKAMAAGLTIRGGYHWLYPGNYAQQAQHFKDTLIKGFGSLNGLLCQLDAEADGVTLKDVQGFLREWNRITNNYPLTGYFPRWYWEPKVSGQVLLKGFAGWWQSAYVTGTGSHMSLAAKISTGWRVWDGVMPTILQYTSSARIPGIPGGVDANMITLPLTTFLAKCTWIPQAPSKTEPSPVLRKEDVVAAVIMQKGQPARYWTDGVTRVHLRTMDQVRDLEKVLGSTVEVANAENFGPIVQVEVPAPSSAPNPDPAK